MGKSRTAALMIAMLVIGLGVGRTATASHVSTHKAFSGGAEFKGLVVKTESAQTNIATVAPDWTTLDSRGFQIPPGESQLVVVDFFAETDCFGPEGGACLARVLAGRTLATAGELEPAAGFNFAFDYVGNDVYESHAMSKALCVRNATGSPLNVSVWLQATKFSSDISIFELDDWTFKIARNSPCSPSVDI